MIRMTFLRRPETVVLAFLLATGAGTFWISSRLTLTFYGIIAVWSLILVSQHFQVARNIKSRFGGKVLFAVETPRPSSSMLYALRVQGYEACDIRSFDLMTYDLEEACKYFVGDGQKFHSLVRDNPETKVRVIGSGTCPSNDLPDNIRFFSCPKTLTEHVNLIEAKNGKQFVWYEPEHIVENGKHKLPQGAYLVGIEDNASWDRAKATYESLLPH